MVAESLENVDLVEKADAISKDLSGDHNISYYKYVPGTLMSSPKQYAKIATTYQFVN